MKKLLLFLLFFGCIELMASIGKITALKGEVYIKNAAGSTAARIGNTLELEDEVITKDRSKALILFNDQTSITVGKNSNLLVKTYVFDNKQASNNEAQFQFGQGVFRTITGKIGKLNKEKFTIKTPTASIGIRGTNFDTSVTPATATVPSITNVGVTDGGISYTNTISGETFNVDKGQNIQINPVTGDAKVSQGELPATKEIKKDNEELKKEEKAVIKEDKKETKKEEKKEAKKEEKPLTKEKKEEKKDDKAVVKEEKKEDKKENSNEPQKKDDPKKDEQQVAKEETKEDTTPVAKEEKQEDTTNQDGTTAENEQQPTQEEQVVQEEQPQEQNQEQNQEVVQNDTQEQPQQETPQTIEQEQPVLAEVAPQPEQPAVQIEQAPIDFEPEQPNIEQPEVNTDIVLPQDDLLDTQLPQNSLPETAIVETDQITDVVNTANEAVDDATQTAEEVTETITETEINNLPTLRDLDGLTIDEDSINPLVFEIFAEDIDGDELELSISLEDPSVGSIELNEDTKIVSFLPASNYYGEAKLIVTVNDGKNSVTQVIIITVNNIPEPISTPPSTPSELEPIASIDIEEVMDENSIPEILGEITAKIMNDSSDTYMEFGYITEIDGVTLDAYIPYIAGSITPSEVIEGYISNSQVGSYTGSVSALVDGEISSGSVSLSVDFGSQQVSGSLSADTWNATLENGTLDLNGIRSDLSGVIKSEVATGSLDGKFYGPTASSVGGSFELNSATSSANGVYGASGSVTTGQ